MSAVVLTPREVAADKLKDRRHFIRKVIAGRAEVLFAQQAIDRPGQNCGHETAVSVHPFGIAICHDTVTDEARARGAHGNQFVGIYRQISGGFVRIRSAVFREFPAIQPVFAASQISPPLHQKYCRCSFTPPSPDDPMRPTAMRGSNASVTIAALP